MHTEQVVFAFLFRGEAKFVVRHLEFCALLLSLTLPEAHADVNALVPTHFSTFRLLLFFHSDKNAIEKLRQKLLQEPHLDAHTLTACITAPNPSFRRTLDFLQFVKSEL